MLRRLTMWQNSSQAIVSFASTPHERPLYGSLTWTTTSHELQLITRLGSRRLRTSTECLSSASHDTGTPHMGCMEFIAIVNDRHAAVFQLIHGTGSTTSVFARLCITCWSVIATAVQVRRTEDVVVAQRTRVDVRLEISVNRYVARMCKGYE
jgi:hypothetical protein